MIPGFIPCQFCCFIIRPYLVSTSVPCPSTERELTHSYCLKLFHLKSLSILHPHHLDVLVQAFKGYSPRITRLRQTKSGYHSPTKDRKSTRLNSSHVKISY